MRQLGQLVSTNDGLVDCNKLRFLIEGPPAAPQDSSLVFHGPRLTYEKPARTNKNNSQFTGAQPGTASARSVTTVPGGVPPRTWAGQQKLPVQKIEVKGDSHQTDNSTSSFLIGTFLGGLSGFGPRVRTPAQALAQEEKCFFLYFCPFGFVCLLNRLAF